MAQRAGETGPAPTGYVELTRQRQAWSKVQELLSRGHSARDLADGVAELLGQLDSELARLKPPVAAPQEASRATRSAPLVGNALTRMAGQHLRVRATVVRAPRRFLEPEYGARPPEFRGDTRVVRFLTDVDAETGVAFPARQDRLGWYDPLGSPEALNRLVALDLAKDEEIVAYYREFGPVTFPQWDEEFPPADAGSSLEWLRLGGEPVWWLAKEKAELEALLALQESLGEPDGRRRLASLRGTLGLLFGPRVERDSDLFDEWDDRLKLAAYDPPTGPSPHSRLKLEEAEFVAANTLAKCINWRLRRVRPALRPSVGAAHAVLTWPVKSLREALYSHLLDATAGNKAVRQCPVCARYFVVDKTARGRPQVFDQPKCRVAAWRRGHVP